MNSQGPRLKRQYAEPTDATGCGWAFFSLLFAMFFGQFSIWLGLLFLFSIPCWLVWQTWRWFTDWKVHKAALNWCLEYYPNAGGTPIVDLMISIARETSSSLESLQPSTTLDSLNVVLKHFQQDFESRFSDQGGDTLGASLQEFYAVNIGIVHERELNGITIEQLYNGLRLTFVEEIFDQASLLKDYDPGEFIGQTVDDLLQYVITKSRACRQKLR